MNNNTVVLTTLLNGEQAERELESLKVKAKTLSLSIDEAAKNMNFAFAKQLKRDLSDTNKEINKLRRQTIDVNHVLKNLSTAKPRELQRAFSALSSQLDNKSIKRNSKEWDELNHKLKLVRNEMQKIKAESAASESWFSRAANNFNKYFAGAMTAITAVTGISFTLRKLSQDAAQMEDVYADVMKTTGLTREVVGELNDKFKEMDTRTAREQLNMLARDAGKLGLSAKKDVLDFVEAGNQINVALGEDLGEGAIRNIGKITEVFKLSTRELENMDLKERMLAVGSAINELGQSSTANEAYLVNFTQRLGGVAAQAGISVQNILGYASALDQSGQAVEMSATALQKFIMSLMGDPAKFARIAGIEVSKFNQLLKTDTNEAIKTVLRALSEKGGFQQLIPVFQEMGLDGARAVGVLSSLATNIGKIDEAQRISNDAFREGVSLTNEYNVKNENAAAQLEKRKKAFKDAAEELGRRLNPALLKSTNYVTYLVKLLPGLLDFLGKYGKYILYLGTVYAVYTAGVKLNVAWRNISHGLSIKELAMYYKTEIALKRKAAAMHIAKVAALAYNVVTALLTGNFTRMRAAWKLLTATMATNPIGLILVAATAAIVGIVKLVKWINRTSDATKALEEATKQYVGELVSEQRNMQQLFEAYKRTNPESKTHLRIRKEIISKYGEYLQGLIDEKGNITDIGKAISAVNKGLREQIALKIKNQAAEKIQTDSIEKQGKLTDKIMKRASWQIEGENVLSSMRETINQTVSDFIVSGSKDYAKLQQTLLTDIQQTYGVNAYKGIYKVKNIVVDLVEEIKSSGDALDEVDKRFAGVISKYTDLSSIITDPETTDDSFTPSGDKGKPDKTKKDPLKEKEDALKASYSKQLLEIKKSLLDKSITEEEYNRLAYQVEIRHLTAVMEARRQFGADTVDVETQITDKMIAEANRRYKAAEDIQKEMTEAVKKRPKEEPVEEIELEKTFANEKGLLDMRHELGLISEEEYQEAIYKLREEYLEKYLGKYMDISDGIRNISADLGAAIDNFQRAEEQSVERKYDKMIKAAGNNKTKVAKLEKEKEEAIHAVRAKYADKQFIITVANVISSTALAAMEAYKSAASIPVVGHILGPIAAGAAVLFGASQIAVAKQQRDAAKQGYARGGYTRPGMWYEEDGAVHRGEFVGNRFAVANPAVRKVFDVIDQAQRNNTIGSLSESDFQTALDYNEHTHRRAVSDALSKFNPIPERTNDNGAMIAALNRSAEANEKLRRKLEDPIVAETYIEGKGGSKEANDFYNRMKKNASRQ